MNKRNIVIASVFVVITVVTSVNCLAQQGTEPWRQDQLIEPSSLAAMINDSSIDQPIIYSIGFGGGIKGSHIEGPVKDSSNLIKWRNELEKLPRDANIVIYCGCCPFEHCPNVRPAFRLLNDMGFTNQKLLNLSHNLKADWLDKGYPIAPKQ